jgi:hypothetical protein
MTVIHERCWLATYVLPSLLLVGSLGVMMLIMDDPDILWILGVAPPIALLTGFFLRPAHVWVTPLAVSLVMATAAVVAGLVFDVDVSRRDAPRVDAAVPRRSAACAHFPWESRPGCHGGVEAGP